MSYFHNQWASFGTRVLEYSSTRVIDNNTIDYINNNSVHGELSVLEYSEYSRSWHSCNRGSNQWENDRKKNPSKRVLHKGKLVARTRATAECHRMRLNATARVCACAFRHSWRLKHGFWGEQTLIPTISKILVLIYKITAVVRHYFECPF